MKILIFTASTGGGHKRAAAALEEKITSLSPQTEVKVVDAMKTIGRVYDKTVCGGYHFMATKIPKVYGKFYRITDRKNLMYKTVMKSNTMMARKLLETIYVQKPDVVLICHPFVTTMISKLKRRGLIDVKAIGIITDYEAHRTYIVPKIDAYVLAEPQMKRKLVDEYGVDESIIHAVGIPIFDRFTEPFSKQDICQREGLSPELPTVLLMAGSFGVTAVLDFYRKLAQKHKTAQFIVITGKNKKLYESLKKLSKELNVSERTKLLYFVDNVEDYMHISDIIVTKPGGLTVTESLACGLPLAIYSAFPGQEMDNSDFLVAQGAAVPLSERTGADTVIDLLNSPERLEAMKQSCKRLHIDNSAEKIFEIAKSLCENNEYKENKQ